MLRTMESERDRLLLQQEIARLKVLGYSFKGETEERQLGAGAWVLKVQVVDYKTKKARER